MSKSTTKRKAKPVEQEVDSEVLAFRLGRWPVAEVPCVPVTPGTRRRQ